MVLDEGLFARLRTTELAQVWYVRDYLQLIFEDGHHTWSWQCYVWPSVVHDDSRLRRGDAGYRDSLCSFIGADVESTAESADTGLTVQFSNGALTLNPTRDELVGPEIAMLHTQPSGGQWMVWRPGEDAFEHLR